MPGLPPFLVSSHTWNYGIARAGRGYFVFGAIISVTRPTLVSPV